MSEQINKDFYDVVSKARATGKPVAQYIKAIVGRVGLSIIDPFTKMPTDIILSGTPGEVDDEDIVIVLWTEMENEYFRRVNKVLLQKGIIAPYTKELVEEISVNEVEEDVLREALSKPYFATKALLDKFTSPVPVMRMLRIAEEMNKSVGTISAIKERLSELQRQESPVTDEE